MGLSENRIFPIAFGNEEETGMQIIQSDNVSEPYDLASHLGKYVSPELIGHYQFLRNGSRLYPGTPGVNATNIERATPECITPSQLAEYICGSELLIVHVGQEYVRQESIRDPSTNVNIRIQRRVVDHKGSRKGCHDNFGLHKNHPFLKKTASHTLFTEHLATAGLITGAGYVTHRKRSGSTGLRYAQKIGGIQEISSYGFVGSMYRVSHQEGSQARVETRCNDVNISDWATWARVGGTAITLALCATPLAREIHDQSYSEKHMVEHVKAYNSLHLNEDGTLTSTPAQQYAVDLQKHIAEACMDKLERYVDKLPQDYFDIALERYKFCEDYQKVLDGKATIELLADRADWAAKFSLILNRLHKDRQFGITRRLNDIECRAQDMRYDYIGIAPSSNENPKITYGYGYKLRSRGLFRRTIPSHAAQLAYKKPPKQTRAKLRAELISKYPINSVDWHTVTIGTVTDQGEPHKLTISLDDVTKTTLTDQELQSLSQIKQIQ